MKPSFILTQLILVSAFVASPPALAGEHQIITFDVPGSYQDPGGGTLAAVINDFGEIAGLYVGATDLQVHGFLRRADGTFVTFDPPGSIYTNPYGLNLEGAITGVYYDDSGFEHGFLREPTGKFTTFDPSPSQGTEALNINDSGEIAGDHFDANGITHGFLRSRAGTILLWDVPGADQGTRPAVSSALTNEGTVAGDFRVTDSNVNPPYDSHGFLRHPDGTFTTSDVPGSSDTYMSSVNDENVTAGFWVVAHGQVEHAFVRARDGRITTFDAPGAGTGDRCQSAGHPPL